MYFQGMRDANSFRYKRTIDAIETWLICGKDANRIKMSLPTNFIMYESTSKREQKQLRIFSSNSLFKRTHKILW